MNPDQAIFFEEDVRWFRLFADSVMDHAFHTLDTNGRIASWNRGCERLFGYAADEILGSSYGRFYTSEAQSRRDHEQELAIAEERGTSEVEGSRIRKDGGVMAVYVVVTALHDPHGAPQGYAVVTHDISEYQQSNLELQDQKRRLRSIVETAVDAIVIINSHGIVESLNPAGERMFGYKADEVVGQNVNMLMPQPFAAEHNGYIQRYLRTGEAKIIGIGREVQGRRKDGSIFPADLAVSEFRDGKRLFTGILRDISDRKKMEAEVLQIAETEQRRIGQELHDDTQQQLSGLMMIARSAADALATLAAHDPKLAEVQARIERVAQGLRTANGSLRELARGLVPLQIDAHGLSDAMRRLARQIGETHAIRCVCTIDDAIDVSDSTLATHLYRITQEAVNNALKHGQATGIDIRLRNVNQMLMLEIADDGSGIGNSTGTLGRGLQIMAYRARLIGAVLAVRPQEGGGTLVRCELRWQSHGSTTAPL